MSDFVVVSTDRDGKPSTRTCHGAEACAILVIQLIRAGHTSIHNDIADAQPSVAANSRPLAHWAVRP